MAFTLRQETHAGFNTATGALTYLQGDNNFIGLYERDDLKLALTGGTLTGALTVSTGNFNVASGQILSGGTDIATLWGGGGGGATDLDGLTDAKVFNSTDGGSSDRYNVFLSNGATSSSAAVTGTLSGSNAYRANYAFGARALQSLTSGSYNHGFGWGALKSITTGSSNVAIGTSAGETLSTTSGNVMIGYNCGYGNTGASNVLVGGGNIAKLSSGSWNVCVGEGTGTNLTSGHSNICVGRMAGATLTTGLRNIILGDNANVNTTSSYQIAVGEAISTTQAASLVLGYYQRILLHGEFATVGQTKLGINLGSTWTNPSATLHVKGQGATSGTIAFQIDNSGAKNLMKIYDDGSTIRIGSNAGYSGGAAAGGIYIGSSAGWYPTGGSSVAIGTGAYQGTSAGNSAQCVAIGYGALRYVIDARFNTALGYNAGNLITDGDSNTLIGHTAGDNLTTGSRNIYIGKGIQASAVGVDDELRIGSATVIPLGADLSTGAVTINSAYTLPTVDSGVPGYVLTSDALGSVTWATAGGGGATDLDGLTDVEVALGAGHAGIALQYNIFMANGATAGAAPSHGTLNDARGNIGMGGDALNALTTGDYNIGIGMRACWKVATTTQNIGIGYSALMNTTGSANTAIGYDAGGGNSSGGFNTFVGGSAYGVNTGSRQISIGYGSVAGGNDTFALGYVNKTLLHGEYATGGQTKLGINLGTAYVAPTATLHVKGGGNTVGTTSLLITDSSDVQIMKLTDAGDNISIGKNALANTTGVFNVGIGLSAGAGNVGGNHNVIIGRVAGTAGSMSYCTYIGSGAGNQGGAGGGNTAIGYSAGFYLGSTALSNTMVGRSAGGAVNTGDDNVMLGLEAGDNLTTGSRNIYIGKGIQASAVGVDDELNIGGQIIGSMDATDRYTKFVGQTYTETAVLTPAATVTPDFTNGNVFSLTIDQATLLENPDHPKDGGTYMVIITQDATGGRTMSYGTNYKWEGGTQPVLSTGAGEVDILTFISDGTNMYGLKALNFS